MLFKFIKRINFRRSAKQLERDLTDEKLWGVRLETVLPLLDLILEYKSLRPSNELKVRLEKYSIKSSHSNWEELNKSIVSFRGYVNNETQNLSNFDLVSIPVSKFLLVDRDTSYNLNVYTHVSLTYNHLHTLYTKLELLDDTRRAYYMRKMTPIFQTLLSLIEILIGEM